MGTRERIIDAALHLFNERGSGTVSTNHIAAMAGLSPGNLYYHFRNKEAIIRGIFARMEIAWNGANTLPFERQPTLDDLGLLARANFAVLAEYRFFYREALALIARDPALGERYRTVRQRGLADTALLLEHYVAAGVLDRSATPEVLAELALACWLVVESWPTFAELGGDTIGPVQMQRGVDVLLGLLRPYLHASDTADKQYEEAR